MGGTAEKRPRGRAESAGGPVKPSVAAVVVTHARPAELRVVVAALISQSRRPDAIVVFDNNSQLPAAEILADFAGQVSIVRSPKNLGGAGGFAAGLQEALALEADWIWLMDDDAVPEPDSLRELLAALALAPAQVGALCCAVLEDGLLAPRHRRLFSRLSGFEKPIGLPRYQEALVAIDTGSFVGFLVSSRAVREVGLPEAEFFLAYDDTEYSLRLQARGWPLFLAPRSRINHLRTPGSRLRASLFGGKHYFNIRNRLVVKRRHARFSRLAACDGVCYGFLLWLLSRGFSRPGGLRLLGRALRDGLAGRLGAFPAEFRELR